MCPGYALHMMMVNLLTVFALLLMGARFLRLQAQPAVQRIRRTAFSRHSNSNIPSF